MQYTQEQDRRGADDAANGFEQGGWPQDYALEVEEAESEISCEVCGFSHDEDVLLLCDACNAGCHTYCAQPALTEVPEGEWLCDACSGRWREQPRQQQPPQAAPPQQPRQHPQASRAERGSPAQPMARRRPRVIPLSQGNGTDESPDDAAVARRRPEESESDEVVDLTGASPSAQPVGAFRASAADGWRQRGMDPAHPSTHGADSRRAGSGGGRRSRVGRGSSRNHVVDLSESGPEDDYEDFIDNENLNRGATAGHAQAGQEQQRRRALPFASIDGSRNGSAHAGAPHATGNGARDRSGAHVQRAERPAQEMAAARPTARRQVLRHVVALNESDDSDFA